MIKHGLQQTTNNKTWIDKTWIIKTWINKTLIITGQHENSQ